MKADRPQRPAKSKSPKSGTVNSVNRLRNAKPSTVRGPGLNGQGAKHKKVASAEVRKLKGRGQARPTSNSRRLKHLTSVFDLTPGDVEAILAISAELKARLARGDRPPLLQGRVLTLVFEKPSLRTRNSFEAAAIQLGGGSVFLTTHDAGLNGRESLPDVARVLSAYSDAIVMRTFRQSLDRGFRPALAAARSSTASQTSCIRARRSPICSLFRKPSVALPDCESCMWATATMWPHRWRWRPPTRRCRSRSARLAATSCRRACCVICGRRFPKADVELTDDPFERRQARRHRLHRRLGQHGAGIAGQGARKVFAPFQVNGAAHGGGPQVGPLHA